MGFEDMGSELKERAAACRTPEELAALAAKEGHRLSDEALEGAAGGRTCDIFSRECGDFDCDILCDGKGNPCRRLMC